MRNTLFSKNTGTSAPPSRVTERLRTSAGRSSSNAGSRPGSLQFSEAGSRNAVTSRPLAMAQSLDSSTSTLVQSINKRLVKTMTKERIEEEKITKKLVRSWTKDENPRKSTASRSGIRTSALTPTRDVLFRDLIRQVADEHERRLTELTTLRAEVEELRSAVGPVFNIDATLRSSKASIPEEDQEADQQVSSPAQPHAEFQEVSPQDTSHAELRVSGTSRVSAGIVNLDASAVHPVPEPCVFEKESSLRSHDDELGVWKPRTQPWISPSKGSQWQQLPKHKTSGLEESGGDLDAPEPDSPEKAGSPGLSLALDAAPQAFGASDNSGLANDEAPVNSISLPPGEHIEAKTSEARSRSSDATKSVQIRGLETEKSMRSGASEMTAVTLVQEDSRKTLSWSSAVTVVTRMAKKATEYFSETVRGGHELQSQRIRSRKTLHHDSGSFQESRVRKTVKSVYFEVFFALVILLNAGFIGAEIEILAADPSAHNETFFEITHWLFSLFFLVELSLRIWVYGLALFLDRDWAWHLIDVVLLVHSMIEFCVGLTTGFKQEGKKNVRLIRVVRVVRNVRIVRVMRLVSELRTMLYAIFGCFRALIGLICLLVLILYFFAVFFTQGATEFRQSGVAIEDLRMENHYGTISLSMFTLYKAMTAGVAWGDVLQPLMDSVHWFYVLLFLLFISFALFAVLNVVTGVFVESALRRTQEEEETRLEEEARIRNMTMDKINALFCEIDADQSGTVSIEEFMDALHDEYVIGCFELLDIQTYEAEQLFHLLDPDSEGTVDIEEFVKGCLHLKGEAKSIDIAILMCENRRLMHKFNTFMGFVAAHFDSLESLISGGNGIDYDWGAGSQANMTGFRGSALSQASAATDSKRGKAHFLGGKQEGRSWTKDLHRLLQDDPSAVHKVKESMGNAQSARRQVEALNARMTRRESPGTTAM